MTRASTATPSLQTCASPTEVVQHLASWGLLPQWSAAQQGWQHDWVSDSRVLKAGDVFVAYPGAHHDARTLLAQVQKAGAAAAVVETKSWPTGVVPPQGFAVLGLADVKAQLSALGEAAFGRPSDALHVMAVTGTNGKTSTALWLGQTLSALGQPCGVIGTLGVGLAGELPNEKTGLTTPDALSLSRALATLRVRGLQACAMEASSIGLAEGRMSAQRIHMAAFTNLTQDHLDYHGDMARYAAAKDLLFEKQTLQAVVLHVDDAHGQALAQRLQQRAGLQLILTTLGRIDRQALPPRGWSLRAQGIQATPEGVMLELVERLDGREKTSPLRLRVLGDFNVANALTVGGMLRAYGQSFDDVVQALGMLRPVPGRMQRVGLDDSADEALPLVLVDYAHTPDALQQALLALQATAKARGGVIWCVFGCGGDRDRSKRPLMGRVVAQHAAHVVVTSDNPRSESPQSIINDILAGIAPPGKPLVIVPREEAIHKAIQQAAAQDIVLIAGKGHETYQEIAGVRHPFRDEAVARAALRARS